MNAHLPILISTLVCLALSACYPYTDPNIKQGNVTDPPQNQSLTPDELRQQQEEELRRKAQEEELRRQQNALTNGGEETTNQNPSPNYPFANKVPGKEGFVFSPYNNKVVDVRGIPTGTLVADPTYAASEKKYFRVP